MAENKNAKIPVASHGLHKHDYNYPWLSSLNFGDVMPCYINTVRKGERDNPKAGLYSQLMPVVHNAFATGRFNFKAIFVPYKFVWRPWYSFDQATELINNGVMSIPEHYPFVLQDAFTTAFVQYYCDPGSQNSTDILVKNGNNLDRFVVNTPGRRVLRVLMALGCTPSWSYQDKNKVNILAILCYLKAFADYYFPNNYVGNSYYNVIAKFQERDTIDFTSECRDLLEAIENCTLTFYDNSIFDNAWDNPVSPNVFNVNPSVNLTDVTDMDSEVGDNIIDNTLISSGTPSLHEASSDPITGFTQFAINALKSLSMWTKRHQFAGARLIDRFLVSRGIPVGNDSARISYFMGQRNIEIVTSGVENNSDTNLGELAGRAIASSGNDPLKFKVRAEDDGIFFVIVSAIPDANFPIYFDGFSAREDVLDNYHAEFDKLGSAAIPSRVVCHSLDGSINDSIKNSVFGFVNRYWDEVQERPRLLGDFVLPTQGSEELSAYHTFRMNQPANHSYEGIRMTGIQFQRLFYSSKQENLMLFLRWYGEQYKEKLPLGDSYEWDDDEMNRKVNIVVGGSQK